ncbi:MAG: hypothetical protein SFT68_03985 [Rickettsiaceae bacterium]|nr:hypothetical protein [Rickettsiaceae bacterium]
MKGLTHILTSLLLGTRNLDLYSKHNDKKNMHDNEMDSKLDSSQQIKNYFREDFGLDINSIGRISNFPKQVGMRTKQFISDQEERSAENLHNAYETIFELREKFATGSFYYIDGIDLSPTLYLCQNDPEIQNKISYINSIMATFNQNTGSHLEIKTKFYFSKYTRFNDGFDERVLSGRQIYNRKKEIEEKSKSTSKYAIPFDIKFTINIDDAEIEINNNVTQNSAQAKAKNENYLKDIEYYDGWLNGEREFSGDILDEDVTDYVE